MEPLAAAYERCRRLHRVHGRTYYLATRLLPAWKRRHVHALYGFTRHADDIVDGRLPVAERRRRLDAWAEAFLAGDGAGDPLLPAVLHTVRVFDIDLAEFRRFFDSMAMDLTVREYRTYDDLLGYMAGSAAAIGAMMLPVLGTADRAAALGPARELGLAFQLTNFIRDVGEDVERGRVYLPAEDLARFGVTRADLEAATAAGRASEPIRELVAFEVGRARAHYARAATGIPLLEASSQPCIRAAYRVYGAILDEIGRAGCDVFTRRATVSRRRRLALAAAALASA
jgi:phytoene synthase